MAVRLGLSLKRVAIDKATKRILTTLIFASIATVFGLVGSRALLGQLRYQNRVIKAKQTALKQLETNIDAVSSLVSAYKSFENSPESIIGTPDKNSKIILDALPSKYDFPALTSSLEKLLAGYSIENISGSDDEVAQATAAQSQVIEIPFEIDVSSSYASIQALIENFDRSIRPLHILTLELSGADNNMRMSLTAKTYYQSEKTLEIKTEEIK